MGENPAQRDATRPVDDMQFVIQKRGYDPDQVHAFAQMVAKQLATLQARNTELQALVDRGTQEAKPADVFDRWSDETRRLFDAASETVARVTSEANEQARVTIAAAEQQAAALRSKTEKESDAMLAEAQQIHGTAKDSAAQQAAEMLSSMRLSTAVELDQARQTAARVTEEAEAEADAIIDEAEVEAARIVAIAQRERRQIAAETAAARNTLIEVQMSRAALVADLERIQGVIGDIVAAHISVNDYAPEPVYDHVLLGDHQ